MMSYVAGPTGSSATGISMTSPPSRSHGRPVTTTICPPGGAKPPYGVGAAPRRRPPRALRPRIAGQRTRGRIVERRSCWLRGGAGWKLRHGHLDHVAGDVARVPSGIALPRKTAHDDDLLTGIGLRRTQVQPGEGGLPRHEPQHPV